MAAAKQKMNVLMNDYKVTLFFRVKWFHDNINWSNISVYHLWMACFASKCSPSLPADRTAVKLCLLSALHSLYSCDRVPSAPLEEDVDGCQATAYPYHPLDVNDSEMWLLLWARGAAARHVVIARASGLSLLWPNSSSDGNMHQRATLTCS